MYTWQLLHTCPVKKAGNFPFQKVKKEVLKNFPKYKSIVSLSLVSLNVDINLFLTEHNPNFTLFLISSYFSPNLRFNVLIKCVLINKKSVDNNDDKILQKLSWLLLLHLWYIQNCRQQKVRNMLCNKSALYIFWNEAREETNHGLLMLFAERVQNVWDNRQVVPESQWDSACQLFGGSLRILSTTVTSILLTWQKIIKWSINLWITKLFDQQFN